MIKIPINKYKGLEIVHYKHIEGYITDVIQFYINCCNIVDNLLAPNDFQINLTNKYTKQTLCSFAKAIIDEKYKQNRINDISDIFINKQTDVNLTNKCNDYRRFFEELLSPLSNIYVKNIIIGEPAQLINIYAYASNIFSNLGIKPNGMQKGLMHEVLEVIFDYKKFINNGIKSNINSIFWNAYKLCDKLNVNACPYCNRMYTFTVFKKSKKALIRPEIDHFLPKERYPIFALSFYNLVPSCKICNSSFKRDQSLDINKFLHPYLDELDVHYKFDYEPIDINAFNGDKSKIDVKINRNGHSDAKSDNSLALFEIEDIYKHHNDVIADLIYKRRLYCDSTINEIVSFLVSDGLMSATYDEIFNSIFNITKKDEIIDTPLGKLRQDIILKLK